MLFKIYAEFFMLQKDLSMVRNSNCLLNMYIVLVLWLWRACPESWWRDTKTVLLFLLDIIDMIVKTKHLKQCYTT